MSDRELATQSRGISETLSSLAERCENAEAADAELNKDILEATGGCAHRETEYYCIEDGNDTDSGFTCLRCRKDTYGQRVPNFTGSLDAAMTLIPTEPYPEIRPGQWWWMIEAWPAEKTAHVAYENHDSGIPEFSGKGETPALALCAAALRARAGE